MGAVSEAGYRTVTRSWASLANAHLFALVVERAQSGTKYGRHATDILVRYKNLWVAEMQAHHGRGTTPADNGRARWVELMDAADKRIEAARGGMALPL